MEVKATVSESSKIEVMKPYPSYRIQLNPLKIMKLESDFEIKPKNKNGLLYYRLEKDDRAAHHVVAAHYLGSESCDKIKFKKKDKTMLTIDYYHPDNLIVEKYKGSKSKSCDSNDEPVKGNVEFNEVSMKKITWKDIEDSKINVRDDENISHLQYYYPFNLSSRDGWIELIKMMRYVFASVNSTPKIFIFKDMIRDGFKITYTTKAIAKDKLEEIPVGYIDGKQKTAWDVYKKYPELFTFDYITFYEDGNSRAFNYFNGYYYRVVKNFRKEIIEPFLNHVREVICDGNADHAEYLHKVFATLIRNPDMKLHIALCVLGKERTGKQTFFTDVWCTLLKAYCVENGDMQHVTGDYNASIDGKRIYVVNESEDASLSKYLNSKRLKKIVPDKTFPCRDMYTPVRIADNRAFFIFLSNNMFPLKISMEDERYFVLKVSDKHRADFNYFKELDEAINAKGFYNQLFTYYMREIDLTGFQYRNIPKTEAKTIIQQASGDSVHDFFVSNYHKIVDKRLEDIYELYCKWCDRTKRRPFNETNFRVNMEEEYTGKKKQIMRKRERFYAYNITPKKLKELIELNPVVYEEEEYKKESDSQSEYDVKIACGIVDEKIDDAVFKE